MLAPRARRAVACFTALALVALVALELAARASFAPAVALQREEPVLVRGSMLAGWGSALPGVGRSARAHVHEYGIHALRDGDGWWPSEAERRGPWFWEVTPADHEKLREINVDSNGPLDELPLEELGEAIDDPFDDAPAAEQEEPVVERAGPAEEES